MTIAFLSNQRLLSIPGILMARPSLAFSLLASDWNYQVYAGRVPGTCSPAPRRTSGFARSRAFFPAFRPAVSR